VEEWLRCGFRRSDPADRVPSPRLLFRSIGNTDPTWYDEGGKRGAKLVQTTIEEYIAPPLEALDVLDFGCGCGRVLRYLAADTRLRMTGCDKDGKAVGWVNKNVLSASAAICDDLPPLQWPAESFDVVIAFSVLTHMSEASQVLWMDELWRLIRPGGLLLVSFHGEDDLKSQKLGGRKERKFASGAIVVLRRRAQFSNWCCSYNPPEHVRANLLARFKEIECRPSGALGNPQQDLWILMKDAAMSQTI
jgi:SAM-dependent methyltransferase